jgi:putative isomerase
MANRSDLPPPPSSGGLSAWVEATFPASLRPAQGNLPYPFIDPGAGYHDILWDWDCFFCAVGLEPWADRVAPFLLGSLRNFLAFQGSDGCIPYSLTPQSQVAGPRRADEMRNPAKPLLAQMARLAARYAGDDAILAEAWEPLTRFLAHWEATQCSRMDLFTWRSHRGSGSDNHPAVYGRPFDSSADVFLNCLMVEEYRAMAAIARRLDHDAGPWERRAEALAGRITTRMWDPIDGTYYNLDLGLADAGRVNQEVTWTVPLRFRAWTMCMPLWAGIAPPESAARLVHEHLLEPRELRSPHGLRSLAANEPAYRIFAGSNPSDWQGPIWMVANHLALVGLRRYGFAAEADALVRDLMAMLEADLAAHGCLHEYYHPETGAGLTHPGFLNWNALALGWKDPAPRSVTPRPPDLPEPEAVLAAQDRLAAWWRGEDLGRPVLDLTSPRATTGDPSPPPGWITDYGAGDFAWRLHLSRLRPRQLHYHAEAFPVVRPDLGPSSLAALLGAGRIEQPGTVWLEPCLGEGPLDPGRLDFDPAHPLWCFVRDLAAAQTRIAPGSVQVGYPDLGESLDVLAACRGEERLIYDLVDDPAAVRACLDRIDAVQRRIYDLLLPFCRDARGGVHHWAWAPGRTGRFQCDTAALLSPGLFREVMVPELTRLCARHDRCIFHWDGVAALVHEAALLDLAGLDCVQWVPGVGQPGVHDPHWWPLYHRILDTGRRVALVGWQGLDAYRALLAEFGARSSRFFLRIRLPATGMAAAVLAARPSPPS